MGAVRKKMDETYPKITIRNGEKAQLRREARLKGKTWTLSSYINWLINTHPARVTYEKVSK